uniref:Uncharacterized protein n=1 Tax=Anguilla anguilla TaxID=7936 RepID=A0A0E9UCE2_ANGAN
MGIQSCISSRSQLYAMTRYTCYFPLQSLLTTAASNHYHNLSPKFHKNCYFQSIL